MNNYVYFVTQEETNRMVICENVEKVREVITKDYAEMFIDELAYHENFTEKELRQRIEDFFTEIQKISDYEDINLIGRDYRFDGYSILKTEFGKFFE